MKGFLERIGSFIIESFVLCWTGGEIFFFICICLFLRAVQGFAENFLPRDLGLSISVWANKRLDKL